MSTTHRTFRPGRVARAAVLLLAAVPLWVAAQGVVQHAALQAAPHAAPDTAPDTVPHAPLPGGLPPESLLRQALLQSPQVDAANASHRAEQAQADQLRLGPNDWVLRAGIAQRSERGGPSFNEREIAIERTLRWGRKPAQDQALADQTLRLASLRRQAAWQASASALLAQWFDARRDQQTAWHQQQQAGLAHTVVAVVQRRVAAGDAAALLLRQAEGELARTGAAQAAAEQRADNSRLALLHQYPLLAAAWPAAGPAAASQTTAPTRPDTAPTGGQSAALAARLLAQQPLLASAQAEVVLARQQLGRLESDHTADPTLGLRFAQERGGAERVLGLTVSMPFGGALRDSRVQAGGAALAAAEARLRGLQLQLAAEAQRLAAAPQQASTVLQRLQAAAFAAETSARLTERAQAEGESTLAELLQQQRQAGDSVLAAALAAIDLHEAHARLQLALQQLLAGDASP